ncbi:MAG: M3 family metallopeptidase, partial [Hyphomicrobiaceae bacterium]
MSHPNPLLRDWSATNRLPTFSQISIEHYQDAFDRALGEHIADIDAIAANAEPATFENTILALEKSGELLDRISSVFWILSGAHTNPDMQKLERGLAPRIAAHFNAISSNARLFNRIAAVHDAESQVDLTTEQAQLLKRRHQTFTRAGAGLASEQKKRLDEITERLAVLGTQFSQNVLADENAFVLPLNSDTDLEGLPDFVCEAAAAAAEERNSDASHIVTLSRSLIVPFLTFSPHRHLREAAYKAWAARGENGGDTDNRAIMAETLALRQERADLLGFRTFADFKLDVTMAGTPAAVGELLQTVWAPAVVAANAERDRIAELAKDDGQNFDITPWDWHYYAEKVRQADYELDEAEIKSYLPLDQVIAAAFDTARRLFGLSFSERNDIELYHPDARAWDVTDNNGRTVGVFIGDYFARASKRSGAWMTAFRRQRKFDGEQQPIIVNVMNFAKAEAGKPTLLSFDDAHTLFHEFGHGLHGLLSDVTYGSLAGTSVERDFVELPSQLFEHWLDTEDVLKRFARHHRTGEAMPAELIAKIKAAQTFNQGFATVEYLASALVDMAFHSGAYQSGTDPMA